MDIERGLMKSATPPRHTASMASLVCALTLIQTAAGHPQDIDAKHSLRATGSEGMFAAIARETVTIPAGQFAMGDPTAKEPSIQKPVHIVHLSTFRLSKYEVTFDQYDTYAAATGVQSPDDEGWGRGSRPVINVSWHDAQQFIAWLNKQTGKHYRMPSEAEWEYAARAGTTSDYPWGPAFEANHANGQGVSGTDTWPFTAPVGSFPPNSWGLYDMIGNVMEWTADCANANYSSAPHDGSAWLSGSCDKRVFRGGSWASSPDYLRVAFRMFVDASFRNHALGFRLAEDP